MSSKAEKGADRIVSLAPSNTEILFALGLGETMVGVTSFCNYPPEAKTKAKIKGYTTPNLGKMLELKPDLVLATHLTPKEIIKELKRQSITVLSIEPQSLNGVMDAILAVGEATHRQKQAAALVSELQERISSVADATSALAPTQKPRVFYWATLEDPTYTAGPDSYLNELIQRAGGTNIAKDLSGAWPEFRLEQLVGLDPQVICCTRTEKQHLRQTESLRPDKLLAKVKRFLSPHSGWEQISAVKSERIYFIPSDWLKHPGPRLVLGLEQIARCIHPELFAGQSAIYNE